MHEARHVSYSMHSSSKTLKSMTDLLDKIILYETGYLSDKDTLKLFAELIKTGDILSLQGHYQRTARQLIERGVINQNGVIINSINLNHE
jgi:hypothetical protein